MQKATFNIISANRFPIWATIITVLLAIVCFIVWLKYRGVYETPNNIRDIVSARYQLANDIVRNSGSRRGLMKYLEPCKGEDASRCKTDDLANNPSDTTIVLSNFYFSTVRLTGCFLPEDTAGSPSKQEYVFSPDAVRFACQGGARAFVFDIWPSMDPHGGFRPILQVMDADSNWRRISMNTMAFETAVQTIVTEIYSSGLGDMDKSTKNDVSIFYLRFCGGPRPETYKEVANILAKHAQPYLLDPSFSYCRGADRLIKTSIRELQGKVIVVANMSNKDLETFAPSVFPFVNMCAPTSDTDRSDAMSMKLEYTLSELQNMTEGDRKMKIGYIRSRLTFLILPTSDAGVQSNEWNWKAAYDVGIHCIPMNIFKRAGASSEAYYNTLFPKYSYKLKAEYAPATTTTATAEGFQDSARIPLRLPITILPEPQMAADHGIGDATLSVKTDLSLGGLDPCTTAYTAATSMFDKLLNKDNLGAYAPPLTDADKVYIGKAILEPAFKDVKKYGAQIDANKCELQPSDAQDQFRTASKAYERKFFQLMA